VLSVAGKKVVVGAYKPSGQSEKDRQYEAHTSTDPEGLPIAVDLRPHMSPVENQGHVGSCTANAIVGALEYLMLRNGLPLTDISRLWVYYHERKVCIQPIVIQLNFYILP
jgi:C1A family cysteine protease